MTQNNRKILTYSILGLLGIAVLVQYEIREYLRYGPSNYWPLKFVLQYGPAAIILAIAVIGGIILLIKHKTLVNSTPLMIVFIGLICVWTIRQQTKSIEFRNITIKNGLYVDSTNGNVLNGTYKSPSMWDGFGKGEHCEKHQYAHGIPVGKWMYSYRGDVIHSGVYLEEQELKSKLILLTKSKRIDIDLWKEVDYPCISIELINPVAKDSVTIEKVKKLSIQSLRPKYVFKTMHINAGSLVFEKVDIK